MTVSRFSSRRVPRILAIVLMLAGVGLMVAYAGRDRIEKIAIPPAQSGTPIPTAVAASPEEQAFYEYVGPRLRALTAESAVLVKLGKERSRNLVELQVRSDRVVELADQIDAFIGANSIPDRFTWAIELYETGAVVVRTGIADAKSAVFRFDWDAVAAALEEFEKGTNQLETAYGVMRDIVIGAATPVST